MKQSLNIVIGNAKRFMAYEIIRKLKEKKDHEILGKFCRPGFSPPSLVCGETRGK